MDSSDQDFLNQIEKNIQGRENEQEEARREAERRAVEMDRIRKASMNVPGLKPGVKPVPAYAPANEVKNSLQDDPRYKEYFERLKRQKGEVTPASNVSQPAPPQKSQQATDSKSVGPGAIVRFDDSSIGIYKDAVSGKDYALFYFLQPDGQFTPQGVFLQSYQAKVIGNLPEQYFAQLRDESTWQRDMILFHLSSFENLKYLDNVAQHEERKPRPGQNVAKTPANGIESSKGNINSTSPAPAVRDTSSPQTPIEDQPQPASPTPTSNQGLVKGRKFKINFSGKVWEAVYWTSDNKGSIVAHATHGEWSLMHLELDRFKDSLELGDIVDGETLEAISGSAAR